MSKIDKILDDYNRELSILEDKFSPKIDKIIYDVINYIIKVKPNSKDGEFKIEVNDNEISLEICCLGVRFLVDDIDVIKISASLTITESGSNVVDSIILYDEYDNYVRYDDLLLSDCVVFAEFLKNNVLPIVQKSHKTNLSKKINEKNIIDFKSFSK